MDQSETMKGMTGDVGQVLSCLRAALCPFCKEPRACLCWLDEPDGCMDTFFRVDFVFTRRYGWALTDHAVCE